VLIEFILRKLRHLFDTSSIPYDQTEHRDRTYASVGDISKSLDENIDELKKLFVNSSDLKIHRFKFGRSEELSGAVAFIDGLADSDTVTEAILRPILEWRPEEGRLPPPQDMADVLSESVLHAGEVEKVSEMPKLAGGCLSGDTALLIDGCCHALVINSKGYDKRSVTEPQSETVVRGPREGFTENLRTNTALIRRKIKNPKLRAEMLTVGRKTRTDVCIMYLEGVADEKLVEKVRFRISSLKVDSILESGYIEEYIEDAPFSPFATIGSSEKPDVVAARILEGRVAIVVDGTPFVLTAPMFFIESFQTAEDYYTRPLYASVTRMLRIIAFIITVFAPAIFVSLTAFHQELIPTTLLFTIADAREGTPFPVFLETFIMIFSYEILREAGIRLPRAVGQAISIVGALIMGDAAISAGIVGAPVVITIAITAVSSFLVPIQNESASILRVAMMILSALLGLYGVTMGFLALLLYLGSLTSFGVDFFAGFSWSRNLQDSAVRMPLWMMSKRPSEIARGDMTRRRFFVPPLRPYKHEDDEDEDSEGGENGA